jgi:hypothetical protein
LAKTMRVEATFNAKRKTVATKSKVGKLEKSRGLNVCIATIRMSRDNKILKLKKISNRSVGNGRTIIATMNKMPKGNTASLRYRRDHENPNVSKLATYSNLKTYS